jgi:hypothetical protein
MVSKYIFPWCFSCFSGKMDPIVQCHKENYFKDTELCVPWNTVIFFLLGNKTICCMVSTCFALGILSRLSSLWEMVTFTAVTRQLSWLPSTVLLRSKWLPSGRASAQWQRARDAATCPQRRHCTLPFGREEHIAFLPMQEKNSVCNSKGDVPS